METSCRSWSPWGGISGHLDLDLGLSELLFLLLPILCPSSLPFSISAASLWPHGLCVLPALRRSLLLSGSFSVCFASKSPKREHLFGWTDTGLWAMLLSQATDSCLGSRLQVWSPQLWPKPQAAWRCRPSVEQYQSSEYRGCVRGTLSETLTSRITLR